MAVLSAHTVSGRRGGHLHATAAEAAFRSGGDPLQSGTGPSSVEAHLLWKRRGLCPTPSPSGGGAGVSPSQAVPPTRTSPCGDTHWLLT